MSRLDELIAELCPDGVAYEKLGRICVSLKKETLKQESLRDDAEYPVINSGRDFYGYYTSYNNDGDALCIASRGEYAGFITYIDRKFWAGGLCYPYSSKNKKIIITKFIFYYLKSKEKYIMSSIVARGSIPALNKIDIEKLSIPVPPLPVQEEILRILDKFTELTAELTAELAKRKQQYQYYRNTLVDFKEGLDKPFQINKLITELCPNGVKYQPLKNVCEVRSGWGFPNSEQGLTEGELPFYKVSDMNKFGNGTVMTLANNYISKATAKKLGCSPAPAGTIIFPKIGAAIGTNKKRVLSTISCYDNNVVGLIPNNLIRSKFLFYIMDSINLMQFADYSGAMPSIRKTTLEKYKIPVPPLPIQEEIVRILDRFDALCNDLASGLPAEIEARKKQYEYYRDKLLTFKEAV